MIEIDKETDDLLEEIASAPGDELAPELLRKIIPDKKVFLRYLKERGLLNDPTAKVIIARLEYAEMESQAKSSAGSGKEKAAGVSTAIIAEIVNTLAGDVGVAATVASKTGIQRRVVNRVLNELFSITRREARKKLLGTIREKSTAKVQTKGSPIKADKAIKSKARARVR